MMRRAAAPATETGRLTASFTAASPDNPLHRRGVQWFSSRIGAAVTGLLVLLMVLAGAFEWQAQRQLVAQAEQDRDLVEHLAIHRAKLESVLNSKLHLVHGLAGFVRAGAQLSEASFQRFVPQLAGSLRGIRSLQLAPDGVVTYVWPLETNRKAIGHNLLDDPVRRRGAQAAIDARKLWVAGPFELLQGGVALIGRQPIFVPVGVEEAFWGFGTILIDLPELLKEVGLFEREGQYRFALRGKDGLGAEGEVFFGVPEVFDTVNSKAVNITFPAGSWQLGGSLAPGDPATTPLHVKAAWFAVALLCGCLVYFLLRIPNRLRASVSLATAALESSERRFRDAIEALPEGFVIYDADDRLVLCNENYRRMYETSRPAIEEGRTFEEIIRYGFEHGQYQPDVQDTRDVEALIQTRLRLHREAGKAVEQQLDDGNWLRIVERRMRDGGTVGFRVDITEIKRKEQELLAARDRAEDANRAKSAFLAIVSHEVRTPLNGVLGLLGAVEEDQTLGEEQRIQIATAYRSAEHLLGILNQILDLSKMEANKLELEDNHFDVRATVHSALLLIRAECERKNLTLEMDINEAVPEMVQGDAGRLRQVLHNLLNNAVKFTDQGGIQLTASLLDRAEGQVNLRFTVEDTGIGFDDADVPRLFEKFTQGDATASRRHEGTGLGLAISKSLVEFMGGSIEARALPGQGAEFCFNVCLKPVAPGTAAQALESKSAPVPATLGWPEIGVLLVEDSNTNQMVIKAQLAGTGYRIDVVSSGADAIDAVRRESYLLILMDISMPGMDGLEAARRIRSLNLVEEPSIIALTANAMAGDKERYLQAGMDDYLPKPINKQLLLEKMFEWVSPRIGQPGQLDA